MPETTECLAEYCRRVGLSPMQTEIMLLHLDDGMRAAGVRLKLRGTFPELGRVREVQEQIGISLEKLSACEGFWDAAREFPRWLVMCAENRRFADERPPDVSGVASAQEAKRFQGGRIIPADDLRLRIDLPTAARLWAQSLRAAGGTLTRTG